MRLKGRISVTDLAIIDLHCDTVSRALDEGLKQNDKRLQFQSVEGFKQTQVFALFVDDQFKGEAAQKRADALYRFYLSGFKSSKKFHALLSVENAAALGGKVENVKKWAYNASFERVFLSIWLKRNHPEHFKSYGVEGDTVGDYLDVDAVVEVHGLDRTLVLVDTVLMGSCHGIVEMRCQGIAAGIRVDNLVVSGPGMCDSGHNALACNESGEVVGSRQFGRGVPAPDAGKVLDNRDIFHRRGDTDVPGNLSAARARRYRGLRPVRRIPWRPRG